jgi:hypothetical protein
VIGKEGNLLIRLRDTSHVRAPPERVWAFFAGMESHYREWHPEHIEWRDIEGNATIPKSIVFARKSLAGGDSRPSSSSIVPERNRFFRYRLGFPNSLLRAGGSWP